MLRRFLALRTLNFCCKQTELCPRQLPQLTNGSVNFGRNYATSNQDNIAETDSKRKNPFAGEQTGPAPWPPKEELSDEEREQRLKVLKLEVDIAHQEGRRVPHLDFFQDHHWAHVVNLKSKSARNKYYAYLWQIEKRQEGKQLRKQERAEYGVIRKEEIKRENEENPHIIYGLAHTSMFLRIYDSTINHWQNNRLTRAMQFGEKIILDCSYDAYMNGREASNAAKQLMLCFAENRANDEPFDIHYCNANLNSHCMQALKRYIPTMLNPEFPMNVHQRCFTEIFPKENLVYLTPHCRTDLEVYNPDDVYIIGAMVDKMNNEPLSLAKAKKLGLRMARLPLDRYLQWGSGSGKSLTLNQMVSILLDLKKTGDWEKALQHVPRRKIIDERLEYARQREHIHKRAVQLSMGPDGILVDHKSRSKRPTFSETQQTPVRQRKGNPFSVENWATNETKLGQSTG